MNLFLGGFSEAYLLFFNWTMCAVLVYCCIFCGINVLLFFVIRVICLTFVGCYVNEIIFLFSYGFSIAILSGWKEMS